MSRLGDVQGTFEAMPTPNQPFRIEARNALARALRPDFVGLNPLDFVDVTDQMLDLAAPEALRTSLIDVRPHSSEAVKSYDWATKKDIYIAVTPFEYGLMSGSIQHLGERAVAGSQNKRQRLGTRNIADDAAAVRAGIHAVTGRAEKTQEYLNNALIKQNLLIAKFQEASKYPGLARFGNEGKMREELTYLRNFVFGGMITTIGNQRNWNSNNQIYAQKAINARLFLDRQQNRHIDYFKSLLDLAAEWNGHKMAIIATRQWEAKKYVKKHEPYAQPPQ